MLLGLSKVVLHGTFVRIRGRRLHLFVSSRTCRTSVSEDEFIHVTVATSSALKGPSHQQKPLNARSKKLVQLRWESTIMATICQLVLSNFFPICFQLASIELVLRCSSFGFNKTILKQSQHGESANLA
eukprot:s775_g14.t1